MDPLPAIALTANTSNITCIANDYGMNIFSRQAIPGSSGHLWSSPSGKSKNILKLVKEIRHKVKHIIALTGLYTDELAKYSDVVLSVILRRQHVFKKYTLLQAIYYVNVWRIHFLVI